MTLSSWRLPRSTVTRGPGTRPGRPRRPASPGCGKGGLTVPRTRPRRGWPERTARALRTPPIACRRRSRPALRGRRAQSPSAPALPRSLAPSLPRRPSAVPGAALHLAGAQVPDRSDLPGENRRRRVPPTLARPGRDTVREWRRRTRRGVPEQGRIGATGLATGGQGPQHRRSQRKKGRGPEPSAPAARDRGPAHRRWRPQHRRNQRTSGQEPEPAHQPADRSQRTSRPGPDQRTRGWDHNTDGTSAPAARNQQRTSRRDRTSAPAGRGPEPAHKGVGTTTPTEPAHQRPGTGASALAGRGPGPAHQPAGDRSQRTRRWGPQHRRNQRTRGAGDPSQRTSGRGPEPAHQRTGDPSQRTNAPGTRTNAPGAGTAEGIRRQARNGDAAGGSPRRRRLRQRDVTSRRRRRPSRRSW